MTIKRRSGVKVLSTDNWNSQDEVLTAFVRLTPKGQWPLSGHAVTEAILAIDVSEKVPEEVRELFEDAKAIAIYGSFYYPLYALSVSELTRVAETAIARKYSGCKGPKKNQTFKRRLVWLREQALLSDPQFMWWDSVRDLRNYVSHPRNRTLITPGDAVNRVRVTALAIDSLFDDGVVFPSS